MDMTGGVLIKVFVN